MRQRPMSTMMQTKAIFAQQEAKYKDLLDQIKQCKITLRTKGLWFITSPRPTRGGMGTNQSTIAQGEPAQYGQTMMSIPDLSHMLVNVRIHEAFINHMKKDLPVTVRVDAVGRARHLKGTRQERVQRRGSRRTGCRRTSRSTRLTWRSMRTWSSISSSPASAPPARSITDEKAEHVLAVPVQAVLSPQSEAQAPLLRSNGQRTGGHDVELGLSDEGRTSRSRAA